MAFDPAILRAAAESGFKKIDTVKPEWIDYNGHMNVAYYLVAFDEGYETVVEAMEFGETARKATNMTTMTLEGHVQYLGELMEGQKFRIHSQIYDYDSKRIHVAQRLFGITESGEEFLSATMEWMSLSVSLETRRAAPFHSDVIDGLAVVWEVQGQWEKPDFVGRSIGIPPGKSMVR